MVDGTVGGRIQEKKMSRVHVERGLACLTCSASHSRLSPKLAVLWWVAASFSPLAGTLAKHLGPNEVTTRHGLQK